MPGTNNSFWVDAPTALHTATMMVSIFPNDGTATGYTAGQNITLTAKCVGWSTGAYPLNAPAQPAPPMLPVAALAAKFIVAGLTATTSIALTLY